MEVAIIGFSMLIFGTMYILIGYDKISSTENLERKVQWLKNKKFLKAAGLLMLLLGGIFMAYGMANWY